MMETHSALTLALEKNVLRGPINLLQSDFDQVYTGSIMQTSDMKY